MKTSSTVSYPHFPHDFQQPLARESDKFNRFKTLSRATEKKVTDESIRDTLIDLANYAIMTVLEMEVAGEKRE